MTCPYVLLLYIYEESSIRLVNSIPHLVWKYPPVERGGVLREGESVGAALIAHVPLGVGFPMNENLVRSLSIILAQFEAVFAKMRGIYVE